MVSILKEATYLLGPMHLFNAAVMNVYHNAKGALQKAWQGAASHAQKGKASPVNRKHSAGRGPLPLL